MFGLIFYRSRLFFIFFGLNLYLSNQFNSIMTLSEQQFNQLLKDLPSISVSLNWDGDEGQGKFEGHELQSGTFLVFADFNVYETGTSDPGDHFTEPSFTSHGHTSDVHGVDVFDNEGEEINLSSEQKSKLLNHIESLIETE